MRNRAVLTGAVGVVVAALAVAVVVTVPVSAQEGDTSRLQRLLERFTKMQAEGAELKADWRDNPTRRTRNAAFRMKDRLIDFSERNATELQMAWDMAALANADVEAKDTSVDPFGYTATDNVPYNFIDLSNDLGARILQFGDDISVAVELEEPFVFYGQTVQTLVMDTNGYVHTNFSGFATTDFSNDCPLPTSPTTVGLGNNDAGMLTMWDDLDFTGIFTSSGADFDESGMYVKHFDACPRANDTTGAAEGCTVFMWDNARVWGTNAPDWDMEAIIYHSTNQFVYQYTAGHPTGGATSTTGLQHYSQGVSHLQWACNTAGSIAPQSAIGFFPPGVAAPAIAQSFVAPQQRSILPRPEVRAVAPRRGLLER